MFSNYSYERFIHYRDHIYNNHINYIRINNCKYCKQDKRDYYGSQHRTPNINHNFSNNNLLNFSRVRNIIGLNNNISNTNISNTNISNTNISNNRNINEYLTNNLGIVPLADEEIEYFQDFTDIEVETSFRTVNKGSNIEIYYNKEPSYCSICCENIK